MRKKEFKSKSKIILSLILFIAACFRLYKLNWDNGYHFHPDERMITIVAEKIELPKSIAEFFSKESPLNPNFFAYGSFPIYLLKFTSSIFSVIDPAFATYAKMNLVGRGISALSDLGILLIIYLIAKHIWNEKVGIIASIFYSLSVFPIQASHFYAVDTLLSFFIITTLYRLIILYEKPNLKNAVLVGIFFGLSLATKVSATVLIAAIGIALISDLLLIFISKVRRTKLTPRIYNHLFNFARWFLSIFKTPKRQVLFTYLLRIIKFGIVMALTTVITFVIFEPYALIDYKNFMAQTMYQHQMTKSAYTFPYTLQYVGTTPYLYHLKNLILWGMGIPLGMLSVSASVWLVLRLIKEVPKPGRENQEAKILILMSFTLIYFLVVGRFAIKFMRYLLPIYGKLCIFSAYFTSTLIKKRGILKLLGKITLTLTIAYLFIWSSSFISIYSRPQTRIAATNWIHKNIPEGSALAVEHWDDHIPLYGNYNFLEMPMYEPDESKTKWVTVQNNLENADYIIIASNRLYVPLQNLTDCTKFEKCYPHTNIYYQNLFAERLGFKKVAEFTSYPGLEVRGWRLEVSDDVADESFTVYDHPKIMIFKESS